MKDKKTKELFPRKEDVATRFRDYCISKGFTVYPGTGMVDGINGDNIIVAPPLIINEQQLDELFGHLLSSLKSFAYQLKK